MIANAGMFYVFDVIGEDTVKYGMIKTATKKDLLERKKEIENALSQTSTHKRQLELLACIVLPNQRVAEQSVLTYFSSDIIRGDKVNRFAFFDKKEKSSEYRRKSAIALKWINELRKLDFVITSIDEITPEKCKIVHEYQEWSPEFLIGDYYSNDDDPFQFFNLRQIEPDSDGDFYTQDIVTDMARRVMGSIDLDPATCKRSQVGDKSQNENGIQAAKWFDATDDGLKQPWHGNVWLNPPFGQWHLWCAKVISEIDLGNTKQIFILVNGPSVTSAAYFETDFIYRMALCIPRGRFAFWGSMDHTGSPGWSSFLFYYGPHIDKFKEEMAPFGVVYDPPKKVQTALKTLSKQTKVKKGKQIVAQLSDFEEDEFFTKDERKLS